MNAEIRVAFVGLVLIAALVVGTTYWQAWAAGDLAARQDNAIKSVAQFKIKRGPSTPPTARCWPRTGQRKVDGQTFYFRRYPQGDLASNIVGYSTQARSRAGPRTPLNDYLTGSNGSLRTVLGSKLDALTGRTIVGNLVVLTIDPDLQRVAQAPRRTRGRAEPATGRVLAMATSPYDANQVEPGASRRPAACAPAARLRTGRRPGLYAPGSTFKLVAAAAALDSGKVTPGTTFMDPVLHRVRKARLQLRHGQPVRPRASSKPSSTRSTPSSARLASSSARS